jgi:cytochrome c oxidase assembly protein Cox11
MKNTARLNGLISRGGSVWAKALFNANAKTAAEFFRRKYSRFAGSCQDLQAKGCSLDIRAFWPLDPQTDNPPKQVQTLVLIWHRGFG